MWLELIKPYTKQIIINGIEKRITLVHPHFDRGPSHYKKLITTLTHNNIHLSYLVECVGFASIYGFNILDRIFKHLLHSPNIDYVHLDTNIKLGTYHLKVKFK